MGPVGATLTKLPPGFLRDVAPTVVLALLGMYKFRIRLSILAVGNDSPTH
jgi:hypothetical protein